MDQRGIFESLARVVPRDPDRFLNICERDVCHVRESILLKQRQLILVELAEHVHSASFYPQISSQFYSFLNIGIDHLAESISPQHVQFISKIYDWFLHNIQALVTVVVNACKRFEDMHFFAYSVIPSFFGFFATAEHLSFAFPFYCALVVHAPKATVPLLLEPFFRNSTTYRYILELTLDMVQTFCQDVRLFSNQVMPRHIIEEHSGLFLQSMMSHLSLLPAPHLALLTLLHRYQWSSDSIFQFFLKSFVEPLVISHFNASPLSAHLETFKSLVMHLSGNVFASSIGPLFQSESIFEIPNAFSDFSEAGIVFVTTPLDVAVFLEVVQDCVELPRLLKMLQSKRYLGTTQQYAPVWVKVFPKNPPPGLYSAIWRKVVFPHVTQQVEVKEWACPHFERWYRQIAQIARDNATNPVFLL
jgi:hypothetical protein